MVHAEDVIYLMLVFEIQPPVVDLRKTSSIKHPNGAPSVKAYSASDKVVHSLLEISKNLLLLK